MNHLKAVGPEDGGDLLSHPDHVMGAVGGAVGVALLISIPVGHGVGLAAVGVDNENLRSLSQGHIHRPFPEERGVQLLPGAVVDIHPAVPEVLAALLPLAGHLHNAVAVRWLKIGLVDVLLPVPHVRLLLLRRLSPSAGPQQ